MFSAPAGSAAGSEASWPAGGRLDLSIGKNVKPKEVTLRSHMFIDFLFLVFFAFSWPSPPSHFLSQVKTATMATWGVALSPGMSSLMESEEKRERNEREQKVL